MGFSRIVFVAVVKCCLQWKIAYTAAAVITTRTLTANDGRALTCAAQNGQLDQILPSLLTKNNLLIGKILHAAALHGHLDQIPEKVLTLDVWQAKDVTGTTVLAVTVANGKASQVPENLLILDTAGSFALFG